MFLVFLASLLVCPFPGSETAWAGDDQFSMDLIFSSLFEANELLIEIVDESFSGNVVDDIYDVIDDVIVHDDNTTTDNRTACAGCKVCPVRLHLQLTSLDSKRSRICYQPASRRAR